MGQFRINRATYHIQDSIHMIAAGKHIACMCNLSHSEKGRVLSSLTIVSHCGFSEYSTV